MRVESRVVVGMALGLELRVSLKTMFRIQGHLVGCKDGAGTALGQVLRVSVAVRVRVTVGRRVCWIACV